MIALIAAISKNNCIGRNNQLLFHIPEDMEYFKSRTMNKVVLMGRKTWESLPPKFRPLPNRKNIVITRDTGYEVPSGVEVYADIDEALEAYKNEEVLVIGGAQIYNQTIGKADTLYITRVNEEVDGDAFFPEIDTNLWKIVEKEKHDGFKFVTYRKR